MRRTVLAVSIVILAAIFAVGSVIFVLDRTVPNPSVTQRCQATVGDIAWSLDPEQSANAALIGVQPLVRGMPARAGTIGLATAYQESKIRNINYGDRDSLGLFQQRPSQGWGTPEEVTDPVFATNAFYDALARVPDFQSMSVTEAAQAVQRSGFPDAYADHEAMGRAWASALNGYSEAALTCRLREVSSDLAVPALVSGVTARIARDIPPAVIAADSEDAASQREVSIDVRATAKAVDLPATQRQRVGWAIAQWAVAVASETDIDSVRFGDHIWTRATGSWTTASTGSDDDADSGSANGTDSGGPATSQATTAAVTITVGGTVTTD